MGFNVYSGNKLDLLAEHFAQSPDRYSGLNLIDKECIVVQTQGMATWLTQKLGDYGIAANVEMPFLNNMVNRILKSAFGERFEEDIKAFSSSGMAWHIYGLLVNDAGKYGNLKDYIADNDLKRWQLSVQLANIFDQYQLYRFNEFESTECWQSYNLQWQRKLYFDMLDGRHGRDWYLREFFKIKHLDLSLLPPKITIFGVGTFPPSHVDIFLKLSEFIEVDLYYLSPCKEFWAYLTRRRQDSSAILNIDGNPILANNGEQGRSFFAKLCDIPEQISVQSCDLYEDFGDTTMLQKLQQDILEMRNRVAEGYVVEPCDNSIVVNSCHNKRREVEILHDQILDVLNSNRELQPRDIIVLTTNINEYEPYINAIFSAGILSLSYTISDRSLSSSSHIVGAFLKLIKMHLSRFETSDIMQFFDIEAIRKKFNISESDIEKVSNLIHSSSICWGYDGEEHEKFCGVDFEDFSWSYGFERLLMGFARMEQPLSSNMECDGIIGVELDANEGLLLGSLIDFVQQLMVLRKKLVMPKTMSEWSELLYSIINDFFEQDRDSFREISAIRLAINNSRRQAEFAEMNSKIPVEIIESIMEDNLAITGENLSFLRGKITFCSMMPMRSIPNSVVAILGLNSGDFPRRDPKLGLSLISLKSMLGDRSRLAEDRYLFLEAILSARKKLLLFYQGQSEKNGEIVPPAIPVVELVEYLKACFGFEEQIHKLQPFDFDYFKGGELISFSKQDFMASQKLLKFLQKRPDSQGKGFAFRSLEQSKSILIDDLVSFLKSPVRFYLKRQLGLNFYDNAIDLKDEEGFCLDNLEEYSLKKDILAMSIDSINKDSQYNILKMQGKLLVSALGEECFNRNYAFVEDIQDEVLDYLRRVKPTTISFEIGEYHVGGVLREDITTDRHIFFSISKFKHKVWVEALVQHLALSVQYKRDIETLIVARESEDVEINLGYEESKEHLLKLIELYVQGHMRPLPIFENASFEYSKKEDLERAKAKFLIPNYAQNEYSNDLFDRAVARCFDKTFFDTESSVTEFKEHVALIYRGIC